jgi:hypothetical protein
VFYLEVRNLLLLAHTSDREIRELRNGYTVNMALPKSPTDAIKIVLNLHYAIVLGECNWALGHRMSSQNRTLREMGKGLEL